METVVIIIIVIGTSWSVVFNQKTKESLTTEFLSLIVLDRGSNNLNEPLDPFPFFWVAVEQKGGQGWG